MWPTRNDLTLGISKRLFLGSGIQHVSRDMLTSLLQPGQTGGFRAVAEPLNFFKVIGENLAPILDCLFHQQHFKRFCKLADFKAQKRDLFLAVASSSLSSRLF